MPEEFPTGYQDRDRERFVKQRPSTTLRRGEFAKDRARVLHSAAFRKLSSKTQVLSPSSKAFARTRLTHSLEVAQVGRELATALGVDPDLVDMACLAHDLGHPPFGHNGESALNLWAADIGGFEGNAQTFRILTRLETKIFDNAGVSRGLNLTRASLDAATKYPWQLSEAKAYGNEVKFGVYEDDREVFNWMREGAPAGVKCVEAQIMDFADDVAYSIHDFEDSVVEGLLDPRVINDLGSKEQLLEEVSKWAGGMHSAAELEEAFSALRKNEYWLSDFDSSAKSLAKLKNLTSDLIGSFVSRTIEAVMVHSDRKAITRYGGSIIVPMEVRSEIAVLKGLVASQVMTLGERQPFYDNQRQLLIELAEELLSRGESALDPLSQEAFRNAQNPTARKRVVVDAVASLTDPAAVDLHQQLRA
ncbi:MAG: deoxyguanosinetriphosphate triphosphohydrolase [Aquiluna sp.]